MPNHPRFPSPYTRELEEELVTLAASGDRSIERWRSLGSDFFMAGLAILLAGSNVLPRKPYLDLADRLCPDATTIEGFQSWLDHSPLKPERFLPQLDAYLQATR